MYLIRYIVQKNAESKPLKKKLHKDIFRLDDKNVRVRIELVSSVEKSYPYTTMSHYAINA
jgi:ribosomal protein L33